MSKKKGYTTLKPMWVLGGTLRVGAEYAYVIGRSYYYSTLRSTDHIFDRQEGYSHPQPLIQPTAYLSLFSGLKRERVRL